MGHPLDLRRDARALFDAALAAVRPDRLVRQALRALEARRAAVDSPPPSSFAGVGVIALGKAAAGLATGAAGLPRLRRGLAVGPDGFEAGVPAGFAALVGEHPVPGEGSFRAGQALLQFARQTPADELLLVLLSGGGSALAAVPRPGLDPADKVTAHRILLDAGLDIVTLNSVRAALSSLKGGGLCRARGAGPILTLALLDVPPVCPWACASGPTDPGPAPLEPPRDTIRRLGIPLPPAALDCLASTSTSVAPAPFLSLGDGRRALRAAVRVARLRGYRPRAIPGRVADDATRFGRRLGRWGARRADRPGPTALLLAGEPRGPAGADPGKGGRCQQVALAAALGIAGRPGVAILAAGTDGVDGGNGAAGALIDGGTVERMRAAGIDPEAALRNSEAGSALAAAGDLIITGPTGTNVNDLFVALVAPSR